MGIDMHLHFRATGDVGDLWEDWPTSLGTICEGTPTEGERDDHGVDYTHFVDTGARYYGLGGGRGPGNLIVAALMCLHRHPHVETIWYGADHGKWVEITVEEVLAIAKVWMDERRLMSAER